MRRGLNPKLGGGGIHHVAIEAEDFETSLRFYTEGLGCVERLRFSESDRTIALLDTGDGSYIELFSPEEAAEESDAESDADSSDESGPRAEGGPQPSGPALFHFALHVKDCDAATDRARRAGAEVTKAPTDLTLDGDPPTPCRYSFVRGPSGESIELMQIDLP